MAGGPAGDGHARHRRRVVRRRGLAPAHRALGACLAAERRRGDGEVRGGRPRFGDSLVKHGILPEVLEARLGAPAYNLALPASTAPAQYYLLRRGSPCGAAPRAIVVNDIAPGLLTGTPLRARPLGLGLLGADDLADLAHLATRRIRHRGGRPLLPPHVPVAVGDPRTRSRRCSAGRCRGISRTT